MPRATCSNPALSGHACDKLVDGKMVKHAAVITEPRGNKAVRDLINNSRDADGYSAMILALDHPGEFGALPMIRFLLNHGADLNAVPARVRQRVAAEATSRRISKNFKPERFPQTLLLEKVL